MTAPPRPDEGGWARQRLVVKRHGDGPALVLLPGMGAGLEVWEPLLPELGKGFRVLLVNLPGFGSPPLPAGEIADVETLTDLIEVWLHEQGLEDSHVVGHSLGGAVALELAKRGVVASVCAVAPIGFWTGSEARFAVWRLRLSAGLGRSLKRWIPLALRPRALRTALLGQHPGPIGRRTLQTALDVTRRLLSASAFLPILTHVQGYRFTGGISISVPVTIAWGTRDRLLLPWQARRAGDAIPRARVVWLRRCGQLATVDDPERVLAAIFEAANRASGSELGA